MITPLLDMAIPVWLHYGLPPFGVVILLVLAILIETAVLHWLKWENPLRTSIIMNLISTIAGFCNPLGAASGPILADHWAEIFRMWFLETLGITLVIEGFVLLVTKRGRKLSLVLAATLLTNIASYILCSIAAVLIISL
jgi:hypothetical protein